MINEDQLSDVLSEFARTMVTDFPIQSILDHLVKRIVDIMPITSAGVTLISPGVEPHYVAASNEAALRFEKLQTDLGEGPCLVAYHTDKAVAVPDLCGEERFSVFVRHALDAGLAAVFTFPLRHGERQLGALDLYRDTPGEMSAKAMTAAQTLADVAAAYLLNAQARADLQDSSDRSQEAALHDALTGLPNRILLLERLEHAFARGRRSHKTSAVLFVDLDRFKTVNDTHGHRAGDKLLVAVARRLTKILRPGDTLARLAGDEFIVLCEDLDARSQAEAVVARIDAALSRPFILSDAEVVISASVGVAFTGDGGDDAEQVLHSADLAMYRAKRAAAGSRPASDRREQHLADHHGSLEGDLLGVLGRGELHTVYQPIVATGDGRITGVEALLRWTHPERGAVAPTVLIPLAEHTGMITEIGRWVLQRAWADRSRWSLPPRAEELAMSVNVSAHQLMSLGFPDMVAAVLAAGATNPERLTLEVTESVFVRDPERALMVLDDLKKLGVTIALDDFGTGYSSLIYLKQFPIDIVKIDGTLVVDLTRDPTSRSVVAAVIGLAHGLGMTVIAEGVETAGQHRELSELGCDACQGYYFARPMPVAALDGVLHQARLPAQAALPPPAEGDRNKVTI